MRVKRTHMSDRLRRVRYDEARGFIAVHWSLSVSVAFLWMLIAVHWSLDRCVAFVYSVMLTIVAVHR